MTDIKERAEVKAGTGTVDWREKHANRRDCAEYMDNAQPTSICDKCECFDCKHDRDKCLKSRWCKRDMVEIEYE